MRSHLKPETMELLLLGLLNREQYLALTCGGTVEMTGPSLRQAHRLLGYDGSHSIQPPQLKSLNVSMKQDGSLQLRLRAESRGR